MGLFSVFKSKRQDLEVPSAPPSIRSLPEIPSDLPEFPEAEIRPTKRLNIESFASRAVNVERKELDERDDLVLRKPIYVDLDLFKAMTDEIEMVKKHLKEMDDGISRLEDFRGDEQKEFEKWRKSLEDVQRKLIFADRSLFGR